MTIRTRAQEAATLRSRNFRRLLHLEARCTGATVNIVNVVNVAAGVEVYPPTQYGAFTTWAGRQVEKLDQLKRLQRMRLRDRPRVGPVLAGGVACLGRLR
jgi:hypothetical protein